MFFVKLVGILQSSHSEDVVQQYCKKVVALSSPCLAAASPPYNAFVMYGLSVFYGLAKQFWYYSNYITAIRRLCRLFFIENKKQRIVYVMCLFGVSRF